MTITNQYLFAYGTLLDEENEFAIYLKNNCSFHAEAKFKGKLYDIGNYPGAIFQPYSEEFVYGRIFTMNDPDQTLKILDEYEGFGNNYPEPNEFIRTLMDVETADNTFKCWVYLYNLPVGKLKAIKSGRYIKKNPPDF